MIIDCDKAFDKIKQNVQRFNAIKQNQKQEKMTEALPEKVVPFSIKLDLDSTSLKMILKLKDLFTKHRGQNPIHIECSSGERHYASIHVESRWGIKVTDSFKAELESIL